VAAYLTEFPEESDNRFIMPPQAARNSCQFNLEELLSAWIAGFENRIYPSKKWSPIFFMKSPAQKAEGGAGGKREPLRTSSITRRNA